MSGGSIWGAPRAQCLGLTHLQRPAGHGEIPRDLPVCVHVQQVRVGQLRLAYAGAPPHAPEHALLLPARREKGQKCVMLDVAVVMWQLIVPPTRWRYIGDWCGFLQTHHKRAVSRDTWNQVLDACERGGHG